MTDKDKTPAAANIITTCTKCKLELRHVVIAQNSDGIVARVKCKTCGSEHKYYPDKKPAPAKKKKEKSGRTVKKNRDAEKYARLLEQNIDTVAIPYSISETYRVNDIIEHKTFGKGIVTEFHYQKMEVLFETGTRILACNR